MILDKQLRTAGERLLDIDDKAHKLSAPYADTLPVKALDVISKLGDQPELRTISAVVIAIGTFAGNDRLVRAGARMMIAHEAATAVKDVTKVDAPAKRQWAQGQKT